MSARCKDNPADCDRNYCQRENRCAERAASAPAESPTMTTTNSTTEAGVTEGPRFFLDHGVVHDRKTGRHVHGCDCAPGDGSAAELLALLLELTQSRQASAQGGERACTCHPDDKPPVPCAKLYALADCRATSGMKEAEALRDLLDLVVLPNRLRIGAEHGSPADLAITNAKKLAEGATPACYRPQVATPPNAPQDSPPASLWANLRSIKAALTGELGVQTRPYLYAEKVAIDDMEFLIGKPILQDSLVGDAEMLDWLISNTEVYPVEIPQFWYSGTADHRAKFKAAIGAAIRAGRKG